MSFLNSRIGKDNIEQVSVLETDFQVMKIKVMPGTNEARMIETLRSDPAVETVEPNGIIELDQSEEPAGVLPSMGPNDPQFSNLWGLRNLGQNNGTPGIDINVSPLWDRGITGSRDVVVAVVDTGVWWDAPDLRDNLYTNEREIPGNGIDDDGNGFIDDVHGWNFADNNADSRDEVGHGTHCAGTIGAAGNNGVGVTGINWNVRLLPVKLASKTKPLTWEAAINGMNYAIAMRPKVINVSWGGSNPSELLRAVFKKAEEAGILVVAAAGNQGVSIDQFNHFPASYHLPNMVTVANLTSKGLLFTTSNFGVSAVDLAAPGERIRSTIPNDDSHPDGAYMDRSGTSMAAPHVSGVAALLYSMHPDLTAVQMRKALLESARPVPGVTGKTVAGGLVNAARALESL
jgi:subtilisin family serine protease